VLVTLAAELIRQKLSHPPLTLLFTVREESGLFGAKHLNPAELGGPLMGFNVDGRSAADVTIGAIGADRWTVDVRGKASHAGVAPELAQECLDCHGQAGTSVSFKDGSQKCFALWNPYELGYIATYATHLRLAGKLDLKPGTTFEAGKAGTYTVGENGPETLVMGTGRGTIIPNGSGGGNTLVINTVWPPTPQQIRLMADALDRENGWSMDRASPTRGRF
jgi:acetylornithine deacetylase/succinyl-diaminopimelate desuccinylase-like protein